MFQSYNMSIGVALLARLVGQAAAIFGGCDVEIVEAHHNRKADAPSGTALLLADAVKAHRPDAEYVFGRHGHHKRQPNEIGIHSPADGQRGGGARGDLLTDSQTITLKHQAHDRALFAEGALTAAAFLVGKPWRGFTIWMTCWGENFGRGTRRLRFVREGSVRGCQGFCLVEGPSQNWGMQLLLRCPAGTLAAEKYVLVGGSQSKHDCILSLKLQ